MRTLNFRIISLVLAILVAAMIWPTVKGIKLISLEHQISSCHDANYSPDKGMDDAGYSACLDGN